MKAARETGALAMLERAQRLLDELPDDATREQITIASAKVELIKWSIERFARADFGNASAAALLQVNLNAPDGTSFLDAMRRRA